MILVKNIHLQMEAWGKNVIIFGADMSSYVHIDNKNKDLLILDEGAMQRLDDTTLTTEAKYPISFTKSGKRFVLSLSLSTTKTYQFKAKDSEIKDYTLCLVNISKGFTFNNMKNRLKRNCKCFFCQLLCY